MNDARVGRELAAGMKPWSRKKVKQQLVLHRNNTHYEG